MLRSSISELILQLKAEPSTGSLSSLKRFNDQLEKSQKLTDEATDKLHAMMARAEELSKTPFMSNDKLNEAAKTIGSMRDQIIKLRAEREKLVKSAEAYTEKNAVAGQALAEHRSVLKDINKELNSRNKALERAQNTLKKLTEGGGKNLSVSERKTAVNKTLPKEIAENEKAIAALDMKRKAVESAAKSEQKAYDSSGKKLIELGARLKQNAEEHVKASRTMKDYVRGYVNSVKELQAAGQKQARAEQDDAARSAKQQNDLQKAGMTQAKAEQRNAAMDAAALKKVSSYEAQRIISMTRIAKLQNDVRGSSYFETYEKLSNAMGRLNLATDKGRRLFDNYQRGLANLNLRSAQSTAHVSELTLMWQKFGQIFGRVAMALGSFFALQALQTITVGFASSLIKSNFELEALNARMRALEPSTEKLKATYSYLKELTLTTPFVLRDFIDAAVATKAFGVQVEGNMKAIADWAAATGRDINETAVAFAKIASYSPRTAQLLATRGLSTAALDAYVAKYGDRLTALRKLVEDTFGGTAKEVSNTFQGLMSNIDDAWTFISQKLGEPLFKSLKEDVRAVFEAFKSLAENEGALSKLGQAINFVAQSLKYMTATALLSGIVVLIQKLKELTVVTEALAAAQVAWELSAGAGFTRVFAAISNFFSLLKGGSSLLQTFFRAAGWVGLIAALFEIVKTNAALQEYNGLVMEAQDLWNSNDWQKYVSNLQQQKEIWEDMSGPIAKTASVLGSFLAMLPTAVLVPHGQREMMLAKEWNDIVAVTANYDDNLDEINRKIEEGTKRWKQQKAALDDMMAKFNLLTDFDMADKVRKGGMEQSVRKMIDMLKKEIADVSTRMAAASTMIAHKATNAIATPDGLADYKRGLEQRLNFFVDLLSSGSKSDAIKQAVDAYEQNFGRLAASADGSSASFRAFKEQFGELVDFVSENTDKNSKSHEWIDTLAQRLQDLAQRITAAREGFAEFFGTFSSAKEGKLLQMVEKIQAIDFMKGRQLNRKNIEAFADSVMSQLKALNAVSSSADKMSDAQQRAYKAGVAGLANDTANLELIMKFLNQWKSYNEGLVSQVKELDGTYHELANTLRELQAQQADSSYQAGLMNLEEYVGSIQKRLSDGRRSIDQYYAKLRMLGQKLSDAAAVKISPRSDTTDLGVEEIIKVQAGAESLIDTYKDVAKTASLTTKELQEQQGLLDKMWSLPSPNWATAAEKQVRKLREETERWRDTLLDTISGSVQSAMKDLLTEMRTGAIAEDLSGQIDDLNQQLIEVRARKTEELNQSVKIRIIRSEEADILAKINKLEAERSNIVTDRLKKVVNEIGSAFDDLFTKSLSSKLMEFLGGGKTPLADAQKSLNDQMNQLGALIPTNQVADMTKSLQDSQAALELMLPLENSLLGVVEATKSVEQEKLSIMKQQTQELQTQLAMAALNAASTAISYGGKAVDSPVGGAPADTGGSGLFTKAWTPRGNGESLQRTVDNPSRTVSKITNVNLSIPGNVYGFRDFEDHVDKAVRNIKRRVA